MARLREEGSFSLDNASYAVDDWNAAMRGGGLSAFVLDESRGHLRRRVGRKVGAL